MFHVSLNRDFQGRWSITVHIACGPAEDILSEISGKRNGGLVEGVFIQYFMRVEQTTKHSF